MSFRKLVTATAFLAIAAMAARVTIDSDTFWHLAAGEWIVQHGQILRMDVFSISRFGEAWVYPGWLAQILLYGLYSAFGFIGLNAFTIFIVLLTFGLLWRAMDQPVLLRSFVVILAAATSGIFWSARPQMLTMLLTAAFLVILVRNAKAPMAGRLWLLPALMVLWSNVHGGFIAGFLVMLAFLGGELMEWMAGALVLEGSWRDQWRDRKRVFQRMSLILLFSIAAVALNPFGPQMIGYPFQTVSIETLANYIQEWQSPNFHSPNSWPFLAMLLLIPVALRFSKKKIHAHELLLYLGFGALALHAARNIALFAAANSLLFGRHLDSAIKPIAEAIGAGRQVPAKLAQWMNVIALILLTLALVLWAVPRLGSSAANQAIAAEFPVEATDYLLDLDKPGRVFHTYRWGGYLIWRGNPKIRSFVDGRTDLFGDELLTQYLAIYQASRDFEDFLARWDFDYVLVEPGAPIAATAERLGWPLLIESETANLYQLH